MRDPTGSHAGLISIPQKSCAIENSAGLQSLVSNIEVFLLNIVFECSNEISCETAYQN